MNWIVRKEPNPGETRVKREFLIFPKCIGKEWRWLCFADILQYYTAGGTVTGHDWTESGWYDLEWSDKVESIKMKQPELNMFTCSYQSQIEIIRKKSKNEFNRYSALK